VDRRSVKTNITIRIDADLAQSAKVLAAKRGKSLSKLVAEQLDDLVSHSETYSKASRQAVRDIRDAPNMGYVPVSRDSLHDR
jgi:hypothetical protein